MTASNGRSDDYRDREFIENYRPFGGLPPLAGLGSFAAAAEPGLSVEESVNRLKRSHYAFRRLHHLLTAHITAEPVYELKMAYSYHAHLCAEHVTVLRERVGEMREPPLGLDRVPHPALEVFFDEILCAPDTAGLLLGVYEAALPALEEALGRHFEQTHLLADQPTRRLCKFALLEVGEMLAYGRRAVAALVPAEKRAELAGYSQRLAAALAAAGGLDGSAPPRGNAPERVYSAGGHRFDGVPRRDERFPDPYNMGVNAELFLYDEKMPAPPKVLMMFYKRLREIDVPEMMAGILTETEGRPWEYYRDMTRQLWDEARHAMMGEVGFVSLGLDWGRLVMVNFTWSLNLNTQLTPKERHAVLYFIEQGLMPKTGKRHEWEVAVMAQNRLSATFQDFDWADEVLHARVGRDWYVSTMPSAQEATAYGDQCWNKVMLDWDKFREDGLTAHRNWWPELYRTWCEKQGAAPDPEIAAFDASYRDTRADLKTISTSG